MKIFTLPASLLLSWLLILSACQEKRNDMVSREDSTRMDEIRSPLDTLRLCTEVNVAAIDSLFLPEAVAEKKYLWWHHPEHPLKISVAFMGGTTFQRQQVQRFANGWTAASDNKIRFLFHNHIPGTYSDIRITFTPGGSWSAIGNRGLTFPFPERRENVNMPTMNFGWIDENEPETSIQAVVLHEFGHALGMVHEHQHPDVTIPWDSAKVYQYYATTQDPPWDEAIVNYNIFHRYDRASTNFTAYDPSSIMHYSIPGDLRTDGITTPFNFTLSSLDISLIKTLYPYRPCTVNETCCYHRVTGRRIPCP
jgi:serralysin